MCEQLPADEYERISSLIWKEHQQREAEREEARRFAVFRVTEGKSSTYFMAEENVEMLQVAARLRSYIRKPAENDPKRFTGMFSRGEKISPEQYKAYAQERMENTGRVTGAFDINLDTGRFDALNIMDGWQSFHIQDISTASYFAMKKATASMDERWRIFLDRLDGKQIRSEEPQYISGKLKLTETDISFSEDIIENNNLLEFYMEIVFDADKVFGTNVCTDENEDFINVYANYDMDTHQVCDALEIYLVRGDGSEEAFRYQLSKDEKLLLLPKMDEYIWHKWGENIEDVCKEYKKGLSQGMAEMRM